MFIFSVIFNKGYISVAILTLLTGVMVTRKIFKFISIETQGSALGAQIDPYLTRIIDFTEAVYTVLLTIAKFFCSETAINMVIKEVAAKSINANLQQLENITTQLHHLKPK